MGFLNPDGPSWSITSYIEEDTEIAEWLTSDEFHIERARVNLWEDSYYKERNLFTEHGSENKDLLAKIDKLLLQPHLWVPEVGDEIQVLNSAHELLFEKSNQMRSPFVKCLVLEVNEMSSTQNTWNPHGLPSLYVKPLQTGSEIESIKGINPKLCYQNPESQ